MKFYRLEILHYKIIYRGYILENYVFVVMQNECDMDDIYFTNFFKQ